MQDLASDLGTAAWCIEDPLSQDRMSGLTQTSGTEDEVDPYRSELQGVHTMLLGLRVFCTFHGITEGRVRLGCDNDNSVRHGKGDWLKVSLSMAHADLVRAIRVIKAQLPISVDFEHVYGHQDDLLSFQDLPRLAQLNVQMDHAAKRHLVQLYEQSPGSVCPSSIAFEGWQCWVQNTKITSDPGKAIRAAVFGLRLRTHLVTKQRILPAAFDDIDWPAMATATNLFPPLYRLWVSKHVSGFFGIGTMMLNWGFWEHSKCPCCSHPREDKIHLMTCPDADCAEIWQASLFGLEVWFEDMDTAPEIRDCFLFTLATRDPNQSFAASGSALVLSAAQAQDSIGWLHTTEGKISQQWQGLQRAHYRSIGSCRSSRKWAAGLITNLLSITHSQWKHRNAVVHERDAQGLKLQASRDLKAAIEAQFSLGVEGLHARDRHYLTRGQQYVMALPAANKKAWLSSIRIARDTYSTSEAREVESMQAVMRKWLARN
jgi:hypothetical protein